MRRNRWRGLVIFNRIAPEELGRIRTIRVTDRYVAEQDRQTVTESGHVLASLAIPTVLKITCEFLVLAESRQGLQTEITRLARWLMDPGEAELEIRSLPGKYYRARCTDLVEPEYTGLSARVTAIFTCRDYRPYNRYSNLPDFGMDPQTDNFTYDGIHCLNDMGCLFVLEKKQALPAMTPYKIRIPGVAGTIRYDGAIQLEEREVTGTLYFVNRDQGLSELPLTHGESTGRLHEVAAWLAGAGLAPLVWDADPGRTWQAEIFAAQEYDRSGWQSGKIKLKLLLQPLACGTERTKQVSLSLVANTAETVRLEDLFADGIGYETPLELEIRNTGTGTVTDLRVTYPTRTGTAAQRFCGSGFSLAPGAELAVSSEERLAAMGGTPANRYIQSGDFPVVLPGQLWIGLQADSTTTLAVTVRAKPGWI